MRERGSETSLRTHSSAEPRGGGDEQADPVSAAHWFTKEGGKVLAEKAARDSHDGKATLNQINEAAADIWNTLYPDRTVAPDSFRTAWARHKRRKR